jgi:hypothetical protein
MRATVQCKQRWGRWPPDQKVREDGVGSINPAPANSIFKTVTTERGTCQRRDTTLELQVIRDQQARKPTHRLRVIGTWSEE